MFQSGISVMVNGFDNEGTPIISTGVSEVVLRTFGYDEL